jgi:hypothetical protein
MYPHILDQIKLKMQIYVCLHIWEDINIYSINGRIGDYSYLTRIGHNRLHKGGYHHIQINLLSSWKRLNLVVLTLT